MTEHTYIYGAGSLGKVVFDLINDKQAVSAFIDDAKCGQEHYGVPVICMPDAPRSAAVYIAITPCIENSYSNIVDSVRRLGFSKVIDFFQIMEQEPNFLKLIARTNYLWMRESSEEMLDLDKIEEFRSLLCDQDSESLLNKIVSLRKDLVPSNYIAPDAEIEYFPRQIIKFLTGKKVAFIDAGAYIGDTASSLLGVLEANGIEAKTIYTFEIDKNNFSILRDNTNRLASEYDVEIINIPAGVWSADKMVSIEGRTASSMKAGDVDSYEKSVVYSIDTLLSSSRVDFIKLDVEGSELQAIEGAKYLINKCKPALAVCLYHNPDDLWEIPIAINAWFPFYKFYIKVHDHLGLGTVLYCVPK